MTLVADLTALAQGAVALTEGASPAERLEHALTAKAALEARALAAEGPTESDVAKALNGLERELDEAGLLEASIVQSPEELLATVLAVIAGQRRQAEGLGELQAAAGAMYDELQRIEAQWRGSGQDVALRMADGVAGVLETVKPIVKGKSR